MFSPEASAGSARSSLRNPRRRQRKDSDGLQQQPRRKRSKLSGDTFQSTSDAHSNGNGNGSLTTNGHASHKGVDGSLAVQPVDIPVREKKEPPKRSLRDDTSSYLTRNGNYALRRLPSFPTTLLRSTAPYRAFTLPSAGLALALTSDQAVFWDYTPATGPSKVVTLPFTFGLKTSDPLPLGAVVRNGPTNEYGILAMAPSNGKITFWENVESAEARSHFPQRHQGVDGYVKLYSGETITELVDIEHAGYVLVFSSGRVAQLTLRDSQGRPSIATVVLNSPNTSNGSFFSFKGLLGGAIRKSIASVKARHSETKGQMEVITATRTGLFQIWDLSWNGQQQMFKMEVDAHGEILAAVQQGTAPETREQHEAHVLDFSILEQQTVPGAISLLVLVALSGRNQLDYSLLEVDLSNNFGTVSRAIPIRNFHQAQLPKEPTGTLLLPRPGHTAFVLFPGAIVVASLAKPEMSPEEQLLSDSGRPTLPFQDSIYFKEESRVEFCGHALDHLGTRSKDASALIFLQHYGVFQITAQPPTPAAEDDPGRHKVTALSKLYQATFFGSVPGNIIDFSIKGRYTFSQEEVEIGAYSISSSILSSSVEQFEKVPSSMEDHIRQRSLAMRILMSHLRTDYPPIGFAVTWRLLWQAEKLAAASELWKWYQFRLQDKDIHPEAYPDALLMNDIVKALADRYKTKINPALGETDPVRQFFMKDLNHLEVLIPWAWQYYRMFYLKEESKSRPAAMQRLSEGDDVIIYALEAAFKFRENNIAFYGLDPSILKDGILLPGNGYDLLPHFWTSTHNLVASIRSLIDVGRNQAIESFEAGTQEELAKKIAQDNPRLVKLGCQTHIERFQWALEQSDEQKIETGKALKDEFDTKVRSDHIRGLLNIGMASEGMNLAEHYKDMPTLVGLIWDERAYLEEMITSTTSKMEKAEIAVKLDRIKERISRNFDTYGDAFAEAFYSQYISENQSGQLLMQDHIKQPALTDFLRRHPSRARLQWINEVSGQKNYELAANALWTSSKHELNAWSHKVELSISKLAMLCKDQKKPGEIEQLEEAPKEKTKEEKGRDHRFKLVKDGLEYAKIQDRVYERCLSTISGALDDESAVQLLMAEFGQGRLAERPSHQQLLQEGFEQLIANQVLSPALLIDVLTLMTYDESEAPTEIIQSNEFAFALKVLVLSWHTVHKNARNGLLKLIWKRLAIKDNWAKINDTKNVSDDQLEDFLLHTNVGWTWKAFQKMIEDDKDNLVVMPPKNIRELIGAGATNGELCIRFPSEDIRRALIADNLKDDEVLRENLEKHRFQHWFSSAYKAGRAAYKEEQRLEQEQEEGVPELALEEGEQPTINGDGEESQALVNGTQDIEMQDS